jgi:hypothetical protein
MGYDFRDFAIWKTGLVAGQVATAHMMDGGVVLSDAGIMRSADGLGLTVAENASIKYNYSMPMWNNTTTGRTLMAVQGYRPIIPPITKYARPLLVGGSLGLGVNELTNNTWVGAAIDQANTMQHQEWRVAMAQMVVVRSNGDGTWTTDIPDTRFKKTDTDAALNVVEPLSLYSGTSPGPVVAGNQQTNPAIVTQRAPITIYQVAIWNRKLTDAEVAEQYQRSRLRFPGVLM